MRNKNNNGFDEIELLALAVLDEEDRELFGLEGVGNLEFKKNNNLNQRLEHGQPKEQKKSGIFAWFSSKEKPKLLTQTNIQSQGKSAAKTFIYSKQDISKEGFIEFCKGQCRFYRELDNKMSEQVSTEQDKELKKELKKRNDQEHRNHKALLYLQVFLSCNVIGGFNNDQEEEEVLETLINFPRIDKYREYYPPILAVYADERIEKINKEYEKEIKKLQSQNQPITDELKKAIRKQVEQRIRNESEEKITNRQTPAAPVTIAREPASVAKEEKITPPEKKQLTKEDFIELCEKGKKLFGTKGPHFTGSYNDNRSEKLFAYAYLQNLLESQGAQYNELQAPGHYIAEQRALKLLLQDKIDGPQIKQFIEFWPPIVKQYNEEIQRESNNYSSLLGNS